MGITDWMFIVEAYNDRFKTDYDDVKTFLKDVYTDINNLHYIKL